MASRNQNQVRRVCSTISMVVAAAVAATSPAAAETISHATARSMATAFPEPTLSRAFALPPVTNGSAIRAHTPASNARTSQLGAFFDDLGEGKTERFESSLGRRMDVSVVFTGGSEWSFTDSTDPNLGGSIAWLLHAWPPSRQLVMSFPLFPSGSSGRYTLEQAAAGAYNDHYLKAARALAARDPDMIIRVAWEMNGNWTAWNACSDPAAYIGAFQQLVRTFRSISKQFRFDWNPNVGKQNCPPDTAYPGDSYVDIIGQDIYAFKKFANGKTGEEMWTSQYSEPYGIQWFADFALAHGKHISIPEWGTDLDDGQYVTHLINFAVANNVLYQSVWNLTSDSWGLSNNPTNLAIYRSRFGIKPKHD